jgi:PAS domain S-box-containing protein
MNHASTILIVDDEPVERETMRILLSGRGYNLVVAPNGAEALEKASALSPDLILLDVMMPGMDGFQVCRRLRADPLLAEVPIIMVTALDDQPTRLRGLEVGADDFLTKPYDRLELRARVQTITRLNRYHRLLVERTQRQQAEEEIRRRDLEMALLNHIITTAASTLDARKILQVSCEVLAHFFDLPQATALLLNEERTHLSVVAEYCLPPVRLASGQSPTAYPSMLGHVIPVAGTPAAEDLLRGKIPLVVSEVRADSRLSLVQALTGERDIVSVLTLPVLIRDQFAGAIELDAVERREFSDQDLTLAQSVATAVGQAMETGFLYQKLQRYADGLEETVAHRTLELQTERDRTQSILEALGEAVVVTDVEGVIRYMNPAAVALTGFSAEEAAGQTWRLWQSDAQPPETFAQMQATVRAGQMWRGEAVNRRKDGALYDAAMTVAPLFEPHVPDQPVGFVSVQRNITPLRQAERLKDQFVSNVSHELRTPLSVITFISGNLDMLYERLDESKRRKMIRDIREHTQTLNDLISRILEVSRIDGRHIPMERERVDLAQLVREEVDQQMPLARAKSQTLNVMGVETLIVQGNDGQLRQVMRNLVNNAIKYTPQGEQITCECSELTGGVVSESAWPGSAGLAAGRWAAVRVSDTGIGISPQDLAHVFERFYRVSAQGNVPGTGLGLSIARELVELHDGHINAASTLGHGSIFAVYLPVVEE